MAKQSVFTKVEQLRPLADGLHLTVKVVSSKSIVPKGHADGTQGQQMRLAECLVGDETGIIIFTARIDQDGVADSDTWFQSFSNPMVCKRQGGAWSRL